MAEIFAHLPKVVYEGAESKNPLSFKFYDPEKVIMGKKMKEHLPFAMSWWHTLGATGTDMFGPGTADKSFGAAPGTMEHARAKVDAGFEGTLTLGAYNATDDPVEIPIGERFCQMILEELTSPSEKSYAKRSGNYQGQTGVTLDPLKH